MKQVYLIKQSTGEYEDSIESTIDATFNKSEAMSKLTKLRVEIKTKEDELNSLQDHYNSCEIFEDLSAEAYNCKLCDRFERLNQELYDHNGYWIEEINIPEISREEYFSVVVEEEK